MCDNGRVLLYRVPVLKTLPRITARSEDDETTLQTLGFTVMASEVVWCYVTRQTENEGNKWRDIVTCHSRLVKHLSSKTAALTSDSTHTDRRL